jgi:hypothetical protein
LNLPAQQNVEYIGAWSVGMLARLLLLETSSPSSEAGFQYFWNPASLFIGLKKNKIFLKFFFLGVDFSAVLFYNSKYGGG